MIRRSLILCAAVALIAAGSAFAPSPAHAYYRVIKWPVSNFCQIWDYAIPTRPWPHSYRVMSRPLPSLGAALAAKSRNFHRWGCAF